MNNFDSSNRRPIADIFRKTAHLAVRISIKLKIHPDAISYMSVVFSIIAAFCFYKSKSYPILLILGPLFCYFRLWCNMLDGMVALESGKASSRGEILNDVPDRISDTLVFIGIAHSGLVSLPLGYWGAIASLFVSYIGVFGKAVGVQREFSGIMSKPWRMVLVHIGAWITYFLWLNNIGTNFLNYSILAWTIGIIILGCIQTFTIRLVRILRALKTKEG